MMIVGSAVFVDTNILVYASLPASPFYQQAVDRLAVFDNQGFELWISRQILREFLATLTRPGSATTPVSITSLVRDVRYFVSRFRLAEDGMSSTERLLALIQQVAVGGKQIHDANIVATMQAHGITQLLTHNVGDFARYAHLITVLPLVIANP